MTETFEQMAVRIAAECDLLGMLGNKRAPDAAIKDFATRLRDKLTNGNDSVAWVEVTDSRDGPYTFHGKELLPAGNHELYTRILPAPAGVPDGWITEGLINDIKFKDREIAELREKKFARFRNEDCWIYQGDGEDHLESLVCPVVISPRALMELLSAAPAAPASEVAKDAERYRARRKAVYLTRLRSQISGVVQSEDEFNTEYDASCDKNISGYITDHRGVWVIDAAMGKEGK